MCKLLRVSLFSFFILAFASAVFAQDPALQEAVQRAESAADVAQTSAVISTLSWVFTPFLIGLSPFLWWPLLLVFLYMDLAFMVISGKFFFGEDERGGSIAGFIVSLILLLLGLSWLGVINPIEIVQEHGKTLLYIVLAHLGIGLFVGVFKGIWDAYYKYYVPRKEKILARVTEIKTGVLKRLRESDSTGNFDENSPAVKQQILEAVENDRDWQRLTAKIRASEHAPKYVFIALFWEVYLLWKWVFQFTERLVALFKNAGQMILDHFTGKLKNVGLDK